METDVMREALRLSPFVGALVFAVIILWRKLEAKDAALAVLTREVLGAMAKNTAAVVQNASAVEALRDAIERGEHRNPRRAAGAD